MQTKRIHCFRHVPFEGLGCIETWCNERSYPITYTHFFEPNYMIPTPADYDVLVIMGGPMGTYEEDKYAWLKPEKAAIKEAIDNDKVAIGICLGSQLIANVLGAKVYKNKEKEIGWWNIRLTDEGKNTAPFSTFGSEFTVFQWHGDTFELPEGATLLASSEVCTHQAFIYNKKVLGLQFHFEVTDESIACMSENDLGEIAQGGTYVQTNQDIQAGTDFVASNNKMMFAILNELIG